MSANGEYPRDRQGFVHLKLPGNSSRGPTVYTRVRPSSVKVWLSEGWNVVDDEKVIDENPHDELTSGAPPAPEPEKSKRDGAK